MGTPISGPFTFTTRQYYDINGVNTAKDTTLTFEDLDKSLLFLSSSIGNSTINGGQTDYLSVWKSSTTLGTGSLKQTGSIVTGISSSLDEGINLNFETGTYKFGTLNTPIPSFLHIIDGTITFTSNNVNIFNINGNSNVHFFRNSSNEGITIREGSIYIGKSAGDPSETKGIMIEGFDRYPKLTIGDFDTNNPGNKTTMILEDEIATVSIKQDTNPIFSAGIDINNTAPYVVLPLGLQSTPPSNPEIGTLYYDPNGAGSSPGKIYIWTGLDWGEIAIAI